MSIDFDRIALRYDMGNHVLSLGRDLRWRSILSRRLMVCSPVRHLDLACGTGDQVASMQRVGKADLHSVGIDCSQQMLAVAAGKGRIDQSRVTWTLGDASSLEFEDDSFDVVTVSFGLRNMAKREHVLKEAFRVLRSGGMLGMLEFSAPSRVNILFRMYLHHILPLIGGILSGQPKAYAYLRDSIERFPSPSCIADELADVGFSDVVTRGLDGGIVHLYAAVRA